jgi:hypothetical protein
VVCVCVCVCVCVRAHSLSLMSLGRSVAHRSAKLSNVSACQQHLSIASISHVLKAPSALKHFQ